MCIPDGEDVGEIERYTHSFVVKIWLEDGSELARRPIWRGYITHVASGRRRYVTRLSDLTVFIALYLREMRARLPLLWRICQWLWR